MEVEDTLGRKSYYLWIYFEIHARSGVEERDGMPLRHCCGGCVSVVLSTTVRTRGVRTACVDGGGGVPFPSVRRRRRGRRKKRNARGQAPAPRLKGGRKQKCAHLIFMSPECVFSQKNKLGSCGSRASFKLRLEFLPPPAQTHSREINFCHISILVLAPVPSQPCLSPIHYVIPFCFTRP